VLVLSSQPASTCSLGGVAVGLAALVLAASGLDASRRFAAVTCGCSFGDGCVDSGAASPLPVVWRGAGGAGGNEKCVR